jgi:hypothetical protein
MEQFKPFEVIGEVLLLYKYSVSAWSEAGQQKQ